MNGNAIAHKETLNVQRCTVACAAGTRLAILESIRLATMTVPNGMKSSMLRSIRINLRTNQDYVMKTSKIHDRWGRDRDTGARGLEIGIRLVKNGMVKIGGEFWKAIPGRGSLEKYEGKKIEVSVDDAHSTRYTARDTETLNSIAMLTNALKHSDKPPAKADHAKPAS